MKTLLLATAAVFAISCGSALAASGTGAAGGGAGAGGTGSGGTGGGNGGMPSNALSTPQAQPPMTANNQTPPTTLSTGTVQSKTSMNPQQNASSTGSQ